jgi:hypothetical protein
MSVRRRLYAGSPTDSFDEFDFEESGLQPMNTLAGDILIHSPERGIELLLSMERFRRQDHHANEVTRGRSGYCQFLELLESRRGLGVTDPRDMVFAHLGIRYWAPETIPLLVDYRKDCSEVFGGVSKLLSRSGDLHLVLSFVEDLEQEERRHGLPSWVPDWTAPTLPRPWIRLSTALESAERFILENWKRVPMPGEVLTNPSYGTKDYFQRVYYKDMIYKRTIRRHYSWVGKDYLDEKDQLGNYESWCVSSRQRNSWLTLDRVLACVGVQIGVVGEVSEKTRRPLLSSDLAEDIGQA